MKVLCANHRQLPDACCKYYLSQAGEGLVPFKGPRYQRGSGVFSDLFRAAVPLLKQGSKAIASKLLKSGVNVLSDISQGKSLKEAASSRLKETGRELLSDLSEKLKQKGQGRKGKATTKKGRKKKRDIFS